ncbi:MAG: 2-succinyl-5-enolpyruvyl-6-hydroxy-3-cyclohexene-1-carboxylic-acid synthase, partial [Acidimicrobiales bacterium]
VALVVGSSMPVRDVEWWATSRSAPTFANRGANGIDGVVSTLLGVATGSRALGLVGDLTMLHDASALVDGVDGTAVLVVADNDGGGIFSFLPQASVLDADLFNRLFAASRSLDLARVAAGFGHATCVATSLGELADALDVGLATPGLTVVVARVPDRGTNVEIHEELVAEVASRWLPGPA